MERRTIRNRWVSKILFAAMLFSIAPATGCALITTWMVMTQQHLTPPAYPGDLAEKRVAVVCVSPDGGLGPSNDPEILSRMVARFLRENVEEISIIPQKEINDWIDAEGWDYLDTQVVAEGVDADVLISIELSGVSMYDGQTTYKGHSEVAMAVYDMRDGGAEIWSTPLQVIEYPRQASIHVTEQDTSEHEFRHRYFGVVANNLSRNFYRYDHRDDVALDATSLRR